MGENLLGHYESVSLLDKCAILHLAGSDEKTLVYEEKILGMIKSLCDTGERYGHKSSSLDKK